MASWPSGRYPRGQRQADVDLVSKKTVARSLTSPWGLAFLPDGSALVSERDTGLVRRIAGRSNGSPARSLTKTSTVGTVKGVRAGGEGGLLGIAVPPTPRGTQPEVIFAYLTTARTTAWCASTGTAAASGAKRPS